MLHTKRAEKPKLPCPAGRLLPHRPPMLLIDQLVERSEDRTTAIATTSLVEKHLFQDPDNKLSPEFFIEIIAQTIAAARGYDGLIDNEQPHSGFLVGLDELVLTDHPIEYSTIQSQIETFFEFGDITIFQGRLY